MEIKAADTAMRGLSAARSMGKEFRDFLMKTNMFALAMGVVIGNAVGKLVDSMVKDLVMPVIGALKVEGDWKSLKGGFWRFDWTYGNFISVLVDFTIIAAVVFLITKALVRQAPPAPSKMCPECREAIHPEAKRCKFCTSPQPAAPPAG